MKLWISLAKGYAFVAICFLAAACRKDEPVTTTHRFRPGAYVLAYNKVEQQPGTNHKIYQRDYFLYIWIEQSGNSLIFYKQGVLGLNVFRIECPWSGKMEIRNDKTIAVAPFNSLVLQQSQQMGGLPSCRVDGIDQTFALKELTYVSDSVLTGRNRFLNVTTDSAGQHHSNTQLDGSFIIVRR